MASYSVTKSKHATLTTTTVDTVTFSQQWSRIEVINRSSSGEPLYITTNGDTPVAEANNTDIVMPGEAVLLNCETETVKIIGDGNDYSVIGVA